MRGNGWWGLGELVDGGEDVVGVGREECSGVEAEVATAVAAHDGRLVGAECGA